MHHAQLTFEVVQMLFVAVGTLLPNLYLTIPAIQRIISFAKAVVVKMFMAI